MSDVVANYLAKRVERFKNLEPSNPSHDVTPWKGKGSKCDDGHEPVELLFADECDVCGGSDSDPGCGPFCPVCNYCCGC